MQKTFRDTVNFQLKPGLSEEVRENTLNSIRKISGVFALQASIEPGKYEVEMDENTSSACLIGYQIAQRDAVQSTAITPAEFHALTARIAAQQQNRDLGL